MDENKAEETMEHSGSSISGDILNSADNAAPSSRLDCKKTDSTRNDADGKAVAKKSGFSAIIIAIVCLCAAAAAAAVLYQINRAKNYNPYNDGYYNISGRTIGEVATEFTMSLEEFLEEFELPTDMRADTYEVSAYNMMPVSRVAQMHGLDFNTMKLYFGFADNVTEDTPYGEAYNGIKLKHIFGEDVDIIKEKYGLDESVSGETTWGEVRGIIDKKDYEDYLKSKADSSKHGGDAE